MSGTDFVILLARYSLACGALSAVVGGAKGRDRFIWFFGGFFFGLLGLIAAVGMPTSREEVELKAWMEAKRAERRAESAQPRMRPLPAYSAFNLPKPVVFAHGGLFAFRSAASGSEGTRRVPPIISALKRSSGKSGHQPRRYLGPLCRASPRPEYQASAANRHLR